MSEAQAAPAPLAGRTAWARSIETPLRTFLRTAAQALAPLLFGAVSDYVFGGGRTGLQWTFALMLAPLALSCLILVRGIPHYARDVATAAASVRAQAPSTS